MSSATLLKWDPKECKLSPVDLIYSETLLACDSWLVSDWHVRGIELHQQRFFSACNSVPDISTENLERFWRHAVAALPRSGHWFPRVELVGTRYAHKLQLRLRCAPTLTHSVRMMRWPSEDPRVNPIVKGPDLPLLGRMRQQAISMGADEALLTTSDGIVLEGLSTSILWWEGNSLCMPDQHLSVLPGVTSRLIGQLAAQADIPVVHKRIHIEELNGRTVWAVNALHGIRPVIDWTNTPWVVASEVEHTIFQAKLIGSRVNLGSL